MPTTARKVTLPGMLMAIVQSRPEFLWFLDTLVRIRVPHNQGSDGLSVIEHRGRRGHSPPLHIHHTEDKLFEILAGSLHFRVGDHERSYVPGEILLAPKGVPHSYRVDTAAGGRWLTITSRGDFERFVRAASHPTPHPILPEVETPLMPQRISALSKTALEYGIEFVGAPLR
jgi:quercetin dioxygenase-like cupin family protein